VTYATLGELLCGREIESMEKRIYQRVPFLCRVTLSTGEGPPIEARTMDISLGGGGVISPRVVALGQRLTLGFHVRSRSGTPVVELVEGRVVNVRADLDGNLLGIEFVQPIAHERCPELTRTVERL
jgi:PilZ domain